MKKVKTLLVTAVAALSMTACSLDDVKAFPKQAGAKVTEVFNSLLEKLGVKKKEEKKACEHEDKNHDGTCDLCGVTGLEVNHVDNDHDHKCDVCGSEMSQHADADNDFVCDICGEALAIASVRLDDSEVQKLFSKGEQFNADGLKVIATSEVGSQKELEFTTSQPDMSTVGDKTVTVTYGTGENDHVEYQINVSYWSEDDIDVFEAGSLTEYAPLPYLPGCNMQVKYELDDEDYLERWWIEADDAESNYLEYYNRLLAWNEVVDVKGDETTYALIETSVNGEGFHDLSDVSVLRLSPTTIEIEDGESYTVREFLFDEYFIIGVDEAGKLIVESRIVNAVLDGFFFGADLANGYWGFRPQYNGYISYLSKLLDYYCSELSAEAFVTPVLSNTSSFVPMNYKSLYPLAESLDAYDFAWFIECDGAPETDYTNFVSALLAAGYEKVTVEGQDSYILENDLVGYMEFCPRYYPATETESSAFVFDFYYQEPESYTNHLTVVANELSTALGIELKVDNSNYPENYFVVATGDFAKEGVTKAEDAIEALARLLLEESYAVTTTITYKEQYEQYLVGMSDGETALNIYVNDTANEDGSFGIEIYLSDSKPLSITNAELAVQSACAVKNSKKALKGVDYVENENHSFTMTFTLEGFGEATYLQSGAEYTISYLANSFEKFTSEAGTAENTWVTVFRDVENSVQATATSSISGEDLLVTVVFENKIFETPESTIVKFLTAKNGAAPAASDYEVAQDGSASTSFTVEGTFTSENLQTEAEKLIAHFGTGFAKIISEAGSAAGTWLVLVENTALEIQGIISATLGESGISFVVTTRVTVFDADHVARDVNAAFAAKGYSFGVTWDDDEQEYGIALNFGASSDDSASNLYSAAATLAGFLPSYMESEYSFYDDPTADDFIDIFGVGIATYYMSFTSKDGTSEAVIIGYVYGGVLRAQISIYNAA